MGLSETLGIRVLPAEEPGQVLAELTVTEGCCQPYGYCAGGVFLSIEETLAGVGSARLLEDDLVPLGVQVSANHVKAVPKGGKILAEARILSRGRTLHVWDIAIRNEAGDLVSSARVTNAITRRRTPSGS